MNKDIEVRKNEINGLVHDINNQNRKIWQLCTTMGISVLVSLLFGFTFGIVLDKFLKSMLAFGALGGLSVVFEGIKIGEAKREIALDKGRIKILNKEIKEIENSSNIVIDRTPKKTQSSEKRQISEKQFDNMIDVFNNLNQKSENKKSR